MNVHVRANFVFHLFNVSLSFRAQSAKEKCLRFAILNFSETLQNIFEIGLKLVVIKDYESAFDAVTLIQIP